jgi:hypothetical protein
MHTGEWNIGITFDGQHIKGSPFPVNVFDPNAVKVSGLDVGKCRFFLIVRSKKKCPTSSLDMQASWDKTWTLLWTLHVPVKERPQWRFSIKDEVYRLKLLHWAMECIKLPLLHMDQDYIPFMYTLTAWKCGVSTHFTSI